ncbi:glycosyltransferase family 2 protein [Kocuria flava]|uniref:glycosyltransferase family 2 protein n=1 Tax=Kocuria flava TaxID=446860 RepID=UPI003F1A73DD
MRVALLTAPPADPAAALGHRAVLAALAARGVEVLRSAEPFPETAPGPGPSGPGAGTGPGAAGADAAGPEALLVLGGTGCAPASVPELTAWGRAARAAQRAARPVVVAGLGLEAGCAGARARLVRELLGAADLVGLADRTSLAVARRLCPEHPALRVAGDASVLAAPQAHRGLEAPAAGRAADGAGVERPHLLACFEPHDGPFSPGEAAPGLAAVLDALAHRTGGAVTVLGGAPAATAGGETAAAAGGAPAPAAGAPPAPEPTRSPDRPAAPDGAAGVPLSDRVAARLAGPARPTPPAGPESLAAHLAEADWVITSHPDLVRVALAAGTAVLPVATSAYTDDRIEGALTSWGLGGHTVPLAALLTPGPAAWDTRDAAQRWATEALARHEAFCSALASGAPTVRAAAEAWWDDAVTALGGTVPDARPDEAPPPRGVAAPVVTELRRRHARPAVPPVRPTVAVLLRTRGEEAALLARAVDDVLAQTFTDWRLLVVADGADRAAVEAVLAERAEALAGRAEVLHRRRDAGPWAAANRGLRAADSELVVLHDEADRWHPALLQRAVARLEDPLVTDDGVLVRARAAALDLADGAVHETGLGPEPPARGELTLSELVRGGGEAPGVLVHRRAVHDVLGDYDEQLGAAGEWEFRLRFLETFTVGVLDGPVEAVRGRLPAGPAPAAPGGAEREELLVRERHLKQWTAEHGIGLPLHLAREAAEHAGGLHRRLDASEQLLRELLELAREQAVRIERLEAAARDRGLRGLLRRLGRWFRAG